MMQPMMMARINAPSATKAHKGVPSLPVTSAASMFPMLRHHTGGSSQTEPTALDQTNMSESVGEPELAQNESNLVGANTIRVGAATTHTPAADAVQTVGAFLRLIAKKRAVICVLDKIVGKPCAATPQA